MVLESPRFEDFFLMVEVPNFEIASDAFQTFKVQAWRPPVLSSLRVRLGSVCAKVHMLQHPHARVGRQLQFSTYLQELMTRHKTLVAAFTYEHYHMVRMLAVLACVVQHQLTDMCLLNAYIQAPHRCSAKSALGERPALTTFLCWMWQLFPAPVRGEPTTGYTSLLQSDNYVTRRQSLKVRRLSITCSSKALVLRTPFWSDT